jgi:deoxyribose-phosphate aldolase
MKLNKYIDHTLLKPEATKAQVKQLCEEAKTYGFASVCVNSCYTHLAAIELKGSGVKVCSVVGFPLGAMKTEAKVYETAAACKDGAEEIDMVMAVGALKEGDDETVYNDIKAVVSEANRHKALVKVILETCLLTDEEKKRACELSVKAGANFVKTSTGFSTGGATAADVKLMHAIVNGQALVKASGGVRTTEDALEMIEAGASRIGTSNGVTIIKGEEAASSY